ncbi:hypothetical protein [Nitrosomonas europaea]|uniref:hypothetical protein n=1 Tax=Nitrosomonas europaea TaxID=915 RepID=UPI0007984B68|nr:hypothetical protein [Nitrosomonas europaea]KXK42069.1 MAG: regulator PrlF [Nitrosomonas europaea]
MRRNNHFLVRRAEKSFFPSLVCNNDTMAMARIDGLTIVALRSAIRRFVQHLQSLVGGIQVDLNAALSVDDA